MAFKGLPVAPVEARDVGARPVGQVWMLPDLFFSIRRARALELSELGAHSRNCPVRLRRTLGTDVLIAPPRAVQTSRTYTLNNYTASASATGVSSISFVDSSSSTESDGRPRGTKIKTSTTGAK